MIDTVLRELDQLPFWALLAVVGVVMAAETTMLVGLVVPGDLIVLLAASAASGPLELSLLVIAATLGSLAGETVGYGIGWRWGPRIRSGSLGRRLGEKRWVRATSVLEQRGGRAVFLTRYLAAVHAITPIVAGTIGMRYRRFIAWSAAGGLSWSALYVIVGALAGASYRSYADGLGTATTVAVGGTVGVAAFIGAVYLHRHVHLTAPDLPFPAAVAALTVAATAAASEAGSDAPDGLAYLIGVVSALALLGRRRWPVPVLAVTTTAYAAYHLLGYVAGPPILAVLVALYAAANTGHLTPALVAGGLLTGSGVAFRLLVEHDDVLEVGTATQALLLVIITLLGDARRPQGRSEADEGPSKGPLICGCFRCSGGGDGTRVQGLLDATEALSS